MKNIVRTIKLDDTITDLFLSFLLKDNYRVPAISREQEGLIAYISESFLMSEFILKSCDFDLSHKRLVEQLKHQRRIQLFKQMSLKNDLNKLAYALNDKCIEHVFLKGTALNADGIYPGGIRFSRDIDLLVNDESLGEAYEVLKSVGFNYLNQRTEDSIKYKYGHHFPEMINENDVKLELHWRATHEKDFHTCPLTEMILSKRRVSKINSDIYCPTTELTLVHLVYHALIAHRMNLGPLFLFDLAAIFDFYGRKWPVDHSLLEVLGIEDKFKLCEQFIERARNELHFSAESKLLRKQIFDNSLWLSLSRGSTIPDSLVKTSHIEIFDNPSFLSRLIVRVHYIRAAYQVSYCSLKFWLVLLSDILLFFKRIMREFFN